MSSLLSKALTFLKDEVAALQFSVAKLENARPTAAAAGKPGRDGKDGVSPDVDAVVSAVLEKLPAPKDGVSPDPKAVVSEVLAVMPKPRDGRDAPPVNVSDVAAIVLAKIPMPKNGRDAPAVDVSDVARAVRAQVKDGARGPAGVPGSPGKDGVSVTDVQLTDNELYVFLDGKKKKVGKIDAPRIVSPFSPGGGGSARIDKKDFPLSWRPINSAGDFPLQNDTSIFLEDGLTYLPGASLVTSKEFVVGKNVSIFSTNGSRAHTWQSTTSGTMFTGVDVGVFTLRGLNPLCPNGQLYDFSDTVPQTSVINIDSSPSSELEPGTLLAQKYGTFTDLRGLLLTFSSATGINSLGVNDGITLGGTQLGLLSITKFAMLSFSPTYIGLNLGNVVVDTAFEIENFVNIGLTAGSIGIKGLPGSGNVAPGLKATIAGCDFLGPITPLDGVTSSDIRLEFRNCDPIPNSTSDAFTSLSAAKTVIVGAGNQGVFFPVAGGNWVEILANHFSSDVDGIVTYLGETDVDIAPVGNTSVSKVGGGSDTISARINIDTGAGFPAVPPSRTEDTTQSAGPTSVSPRDLLRISQGTRLQIWVANLTGTANITVAANAKLIITNGF